MTLLTLHNYNFSNEEPISIHHELKEWKELNTDDEMMSIEGFNIDDPK